MGDRQILQHLEGSTTSRQNLVHVVAVPLGTRTSVEAQRVVAVEPMIAALRR
jgi:hypothetical protein